MPAWLPSHSGFNAGVPPAKLVYFDEVQQVITLDFTPAQKSLSISGCTGACDRSRDCQENLLQALRQLLIDYPQHRSSSKLAQQTPKRPFKELWPFLQDPLDILFVPKKVIL